MRKLTIMRKKAAAASLCKFKVYVEDHTESEIVVAGIPCKKIGELKNGEESTFEVSTDAVKLVVIADMASKDWCNDIYQLPQGEEPIYLTGKAQTKPMAGNPFVFENNPYAQQNPNTKTKPKMPFWAILLVILCSLGGFLIGRAVMESILG